MRPRNVCKAVHLGVAVGMVLCAALAVRADDEGIKLFASGDLSGWVEEQHNFFKAKNPKVATWSIKDGVISCDGSYGNCGFLRYDKKLADFTLRLEYRMSKGCNSG